MLSLAYRLDDAGGLLVQLFIMAVFGAICAAVAAGRGRSPAGWFCIGFIAPCLGVILVLVLPDLNQQEARERRLTDENRRLREIVRKDRMVADSRHDVTNRRLRVHDAAIGVDTAEGAEQIARAASAPPPLPGESTASVEEEWMYADGGMPQGPVSIATLQELWRDGKVKAGTLVWTTGMSEWLPITRVTRLSRLLSA